MLANALKHGEIPIFPSSYLFYTFVRRFLEKRKKRWCDVLFSLEKPEHLVYFKGDMDNIDTSRSVGVTLTLASLFYSDSDIPTFVVCFCSDVLAKTLRSMSHHASLAVQQIGGDPRVAFQPLHVFQLRPLWRR